MRELANDLWVAEQELSFVGIEVGARMTVVRVEGGRGQLFIHSPIDPTPALLDEVRGIGEVTWLVAPNRFHHLWITPWRETFPAAEVLVTPGLPKKRPDLADATVLESDSVSPVPGLEVERVRGIPMIDELVWFHAASATLILTDLAFNVGDEAPALTRLAFRCLGRYGSLGPSFMERLLMRDRDAFRASFERILGWPFKRVIVSHGQPCEEGCRESLTRNYAWVLGSG
jgi:hypothetical protein